MAAFRRRPAPRAGEDAADFDPYTTALGWLGARELSTRQLRARLARCTRDAEAVQRAIERLTASGALDDRRTAAAYARTAAQVRGRGRDRIERELAAMGIDEDTARAALDEACEPASEQERLTRTLDRRARGRNLAEPAEARRLFAALLRQGFEPEAIRRALARRRAADPGE